MNSFIPFSTSAHTNCLIQLLKNVAKSLCFRLAVTEYSTDLTSLVKRFIYAFQDPLNQPDRPKKCAFYALLGSCQPGSYHLYF